MPKPSLTQLREIAQRVIDIAMDKMPDSDSASVCPECQSPIPIGHWPICPHGKVLAQDAQVHSRERAVIYRAPDGSYAHPARADQPMPAKYLRRGYQREEIFSISAHERQTGSVHEATNFNHGNEPMPDKEPQIIGAPKELRDRLITDLRDAAASGPWTTRESAEPESFTTVAKIG